MPLANPSSFARSRSTDSRAPAASPRLARTSARVYSNDAASSSGAVRMAASMISDASSDSSASSRTPAAKRSISKGSPPPRITSKAALTHLSGPPPKRAMLETSILPIWVAWTVTFALTGRASVAKACRSFSGSASPRPTARAIAKRDAPTCRSEARRSASAMKPLVALSTLCVASRSLGRPVSTLAMTLPAPSRYSITPTGSSSSNSPRMAWAVPSSTSSSSKRTRRGPFFSPRA